MVARNKTNVHAQLLYRQPDGTANARKCRNKRRVISGDLFSIEAIRYMIHVLNNNLGFAIFMSEKTDDRKATHGDGSKPFQAGR
jgi:hypothetical protein